LQWSGTKDAKQGQPEEIIESKQQGIMLRQNEKDLRQACHLHSLSVNVRHGLLQELKTENSVTSISTKNARSCRLTKVRTACFFIGRMERRKIKETGKHTHV
jgi:hypothetical protein